MQGLVFSSTDAHLIHLILLEYVFDLSLRVDKLKTVFWAYTTFYLTLVCWCLIECPVIQFRVSKDFFLTCHLVWYEMKFMGIKIKVSGELLPLSSNPYVKFQVWTSLVMEINKSIGILNWKFIKMHKQFLFWENVNFQGPIILLCLEI